MQTIKKNLPGIAVCLSIAIPSWLLGKLVPVIGGPVFSILLGMIIALLWTPGTVCKPGIGFTSKKILQAAVVLLGFGICSLGLKNGVEKITKVNSPCLSSSAPSPRRCWWPL